MVPAGDARGAAHSSISTSPGLVGAVASLMELLGNHSGNGMHTLSTKSTGGLRRFAMRGAHLGEGDAREAVGQDLGILCRGAWQQGHRHHGGANLGGGRHEQLPQARYAQRHIGLSPACSHTRACQALAPRRRCGQARLAGSPVCSLPQAPHGRGACMLPGSAQLVDCTCHVAGIEVVKFLGSQQADSLPWGHLGTEGALDRFLQPARPPPPQEPSGRAGT